MTLVNGMIQRTCVLLLVQQATEVKCGCLLVLCLFLEDKLCVSHDVLKLCISHLGKILAHFLCQECEVVDEILVFSDEVRAQFGILCCHTERTRVEVALAHHHTSKHDKCQCSESKFLGSKQRHEDDVATGLQLTVNLHANLTSQSVLHERLLGFRQSYLRRYTGKSHTRCRACSRSALGSRDNDKVSLCLCHTGGNSSHSALCHEFHADGSLRINVLEVEDKLGEVLDGVDVVMRWWRDERDARDGVAGLGDNLVYLESRQLTAFSRLGSLSHLNLYFLSIH